MLIALLEFLAVQEDALLLALPLELLLYSLESQLVPMLLDPLVWWAILPFIYAVPVLLLTSSSSSSRYKTYLARVIAPIRLHHSSLLFLNTSKERQQILQRPLPSARVFFLIAAGLMVYQYAYPKSRPPPSTTTTTKIDPPARHGGDLVAHSLAQHGVQFVFTLIGGHISPILVGCERYGIRVMDVRHEATAVFAADAVSRLSGDDTNRPTTSCHKCKRQVGVACVTAGPGVTNTITALQNATMAQTPLVLLGGATLGLLRHKGSLQDMDQLSLLKRVVKWQTSVGKLEEIVPAMEEAFAQAVTGVPGPVFVELPLDVLYPESTIRQQILAKFHGKSGLVNYLSQCYLNYYLKRLYGHGGVDAPRNTLAAIPRPIPSKVATDHQVHQVAQLLTSKSTRPVLVVGPPATRGNNVQEVVQALTLLQIPVFLTGGARGLLGRDDAGAAKYHIRHKRSAALQQADCVILLGVPCDFRLNYGRSFRSSTQLVFVTTDPHHLTWNKRPHMGVHGSVPDFLVRLAHQVNGTQLSSWAKWTQQLQETCAQRDAEIQQQAKVGLPPVPINANQQPLAGLPSCNNHSSQQQQKSEEASVCNPIAVCLAINKTLQDPSILVCDGGDFIGTAAYTVRPHGPLQWLDPGPFGTLGVGAGFALGAKLVHPDATVVLLWGDGSAAYSLMEWDTFVRHNLPLVSVIGNDACWTQIHRDQQTILDSSAACMLAYSRYDQVAEALGGKGYQVTTEKELEKTLVQAYRDAKTKPVVVNVRIGKTDFRDGSISV